MTAKAYPRKKPSNAHVFVIAESLIGLALARPPCATHVDSDVARKRQSDDTFALRAWPFRGKVKLNQLDTKWTGRFPESVGHTRWQRKRKAHPRWSKKCATLSFRPWILNQANQGFAIAQVSQCRHSAMKQNLDSDRSLNSR